MKSFSSLKDSALKTLENKWGQFVAITLVAYVIGSGVGFVPYVGTLLTLAVIPLGYGYSIAILKNYRGGEIQLVDIRCLQKYRSFGESASDTSSKRCLYILVVAASHRAGLYKVHILHNDRICA